MKNFNNLNFESVARKISTRVPLIIIILALLMTVVHSVQTALKYNSLANYYKASKQNLEATQANADVNKPESVSFYASAKVRGTDLVNLENEYVSFMNQVDLAQSTKQKDTIQSHLDSIASNMKKYLDVNDASFASQWYFGIDSGGEWYCKTNYDFPNQNELQPIVFLQTNKDVSKVNGYMLADFNTKTGVFSNLKFYMTYTGLEFILDDSGQPLNSGVSTPAAYNFASLPAIVWNVSIKDGVISKGYKYKTIDAYDSNKSDETEAESVSSDESVSDTIN
jgi:hypothetical protein